MDTVSGGATPCPVGCGHSRIWLPIPTALGLSAEPVSHTTGMQGHCSGHGLTTGSSAPCRPAGVVSAASDRVCAGRGQPRGCCSGQSQPGLGHTHLLWALGGSLLLLSRLSPRPKSDQDKSEHRPDPRPGQAGLVARRLATCWWREPCVRLSSSASVTKAGCGQARVPTAVRQDLTGKNQREKSGPGPLVGWHWDTQGPLGGLPVGQDGQEGAPRTHSSPTSGVRGPRGCWAGRALEGRATRLPRQVPSGLCGSASLLSGRRH